MSQLLAFARPLSLGWVVLAQRLSGAPRQRRPGFALTEPAVFRSECFAEDLPEAPAAKPLKHGRRGAKRA
mgnify:CR=1 FL=1